MFNELFGLSIIIFVACSPRHSVQIDCIPKSIIEICEEIKGDKDSLAILSDYLFFNGFYQTGFEVTENQDWNSFVNYYVGDAKIPDNIDILYANTVIDSVSKEVDILMLNEMHQLPYHRIFAHSLLDILWNNGYTYLGIEALNNDSGIVITHQGYIQMDVGYYTNESCFANFINYAVKKGFIIISYEPTKANYQILGNRDSLMCQNILNKWNVQKGKLFLYCGGMHLANSIYKLRNYLEKNTSHQILSINQFYLNYEMKSDIQNDLRKKLSKINLPSIIVDGNSFFTLQSDYDLEVIHPQYYKDLSNIDIIYKNIYSSNCLNPTFATDSTYIMIYPKDISDYCNVVPAWRYFSKRAPQRLKFNLPINYYDAIFISTTSQYSQKFIVSNR